MRVFVTGATGFVGSAVVRELLSNGHQVVGLARSDDSAAASQAAGAEVRRGTLTDLDVLRSEAAASDGVIHTAFIHDFSNYEASLVADRRAIETMGEALAGSDRPFVITSATGIVASARHATEVATEDDAPNPASPSADRGASEVLALSFAERGVRVSVVRLGASVHSADDRHGFIPAVIGVARAKGAAAYIGDGANRWPAVHQLDAARLYRLALEEAPAGTRLHGVAEEGIPMRDIAEVIGKRLGVTVTSVSTEDAGEHFGWLAGFLAMDNPVSSAATRKLLDWRPEHQGLIADLEAGYYFES